MEQSKSGREVKDREVKTLFSAIGFGKHNGIIPYADPCAMPLVPATMGH